MASKRDADTAVDREESSNARNVMLSIPTCAQCRRPIGEGDGDSRYRCGPCNAKKAERARLRRKREREANTSPESIRRRDFQKLKEEADQAVKALNERTRAALAGVTAAGTLAMLPRPAMLPPACPRRF